MPPIDTGPIHARLNQDLEFFAEHAPLFIKTKAGGDLVKLKLNRAQRYMQMRAEEQLKSKGWVRMLLLKGRQQGGSTWVQARFYQKVTRRVGTSAFILSHEGSTTNKLFDMVARFQDNIHESMRPAVGKDNPRQLTFPGLNSDYAAGTAGNEQVGRGGTAQLFHGSEAAYWEKAYEIQDGALKSIGLAPGTEVILESTANGPTGLFYEKCQQALHGVGDYILVFVPWFWQTEYEREDDETDLTEEEEVYIKTYFENKIFPGDTTSITRAAARRKILWRRAEIVDLSTGQNVESGRAKFRTIYPSNPIEAFLMTGVGIVRSDAIESARRTDIKAVDQFAARILGVDPAGDGKKADRTILTLRQGRKVEKVIKYPKMKPMELAGIVAKMIVEEDLDMVFIDRGYGEGTIDRLHELGYGRKVIGVSFNEKALNPLYSNKRSEIIIEGAKWINEGGVSIPDGPEELIGEGPAAFCGGDEIHADFASMPLDRETSNGVKYMPPKEEIKKVLGRSPDIFDAFALTFAYPVRREGAATHWRKTNSATKAGGGPLASMNRRRARGG